MEININLFIFLKKYIKFTFNHYLQLYVKLKQMCYKLVYAHNI